MMAFFEITDLCLSQWECVNKLLFDQTPYDIGQTVGVRLRDAIRTLGMTHSLMRMR